MRNQSSGLTVGSMWSPTHLGEYRYLIVFLCVICHAIRGRRFWMGAQSLAQDLTVLQLDRRCAECSVRHHAICQALDIQHLHELTDIMSHHHFAAGDVIMHQGDVSKLFAIIVSGAAKLTRMLPDGREQVVGLVTPSCVLGDTTSTVSHDTVECLTDVELCCFRRKPFKAVLDRHPELASSLLHKASNDLDAARNWLTVLGRLGATEKVAHFLAWLWKQEKSGCSHRPPANDTMLIHLLFKREEIAGFLGMTTETVSRNMTKLKAMGIVDLLDAKKVQILDLNRLLELAMDYEDGSSEI